VPALTPQSTAPQAQKSRFVVTGIIVIAVATVFVSIVMAYSTVMVIMVVAVAAFTVILVMASPCVAMLFDEQINAIPKACSCSTHAFLAAHIVGAPSFIVCELGCRNLCLSTVFV
jgi:nitrogen fixation protein FixH